MVDFPKLGDLDVGGKRVLVRVDLNVPVDADGTISDDTRIQRLVPTLTDLVSRGACTALLSHFGRPKGKRVEEMSLGFAAMAISEAMNGLDIGFVSDCIGKAPESVMKGLRPGEVVLMENLRFHPGEEANDPAFAEALARLGDAYVNDAFSASHRAHASVVGLPARLPHAAGLLMAEELEALDRALGNPERPVMAIVGGAKVSTKLALLGNLVEKMDVLAIGGGMANTFLHADGHDVGKSLCEPDMAAQARAIMEAARDAGCDLILPVDARIETGAGDFETVAVDAVPGDARILDIGPASADLIGNRIPACKTVVWNGPVGLFEKPPFDESTVMLARTTATLTRARLIVSVAGGGDTVAALAHAGCAQGFSYVSTAGGAFLEWLEGKTLPGVAALTA